MSGSTQELGAVAYEAYGDAVGWTAFNGERIKNWPSQDPIRRRAWERAAESVAEHAMIAAAAALISSIAEERRGEALAALRCVVNGGCGDAAQHYAEPGGAAGACQRPAGRVLMAGGGLAVFVERPEGTEEA